MSVRSTRRRRFLAFAVLGAACIALGIRPQVLEVGRSGPHIWVREGDIVSLRYTQSMYGVPVEERFRVEGGRLSLFEIDASDAALEYLGIERRGANNASRVLQEFFIPAASVGSQSLSAGGRRIALSDVPAEGGRIRVRLTRQPLIAYLISLIYEHHRKKEKDRNEQDYKAGKIDKREYEIRIDQNRRDSVF